VNRVTRIHYIHWHAEEAVQRAARLRKLGYLSIPIESTGRLPSARCAPIPRRRS